MLVRLLESAYGRASVAVSAAKYVIVDQVTPVYKNENKLN